MKIYDALSVSLLITSSKCHKLPSCVYCQFEHFLHSKRSILFRIAFIKQIFFTFLDLLTLFFILYSDCSIQKYCFIQIAANVRDFNGNCTSAREEFFLRKITFSNFDEKLKRFLRYCFESFSQAN